MGAGLAVYLKPHSSLPVGGACERLDGLSKGNGGRDCASWGHHGDHEYSPARRKTERQIYLLCTWLRAGVLSEAAGSDRELTILGSPRPAFVASMKQVGFIGYGSMGSMLVNGLLTSGSLEPGQVVISNRTIAKLEDLARRWHGITITDDNRKTAGGCGLLFLCVRPLDLLEVLQEIRDVLLESSHLVSIAACVTLADIGNLFPGQITKVIPSVTSEVGEGISLVCHNGKVTGGRREYLEGLLNATSRVIYVKESDFEVAADLTSCAPGLIASIFDHFTQAGVRHSDIPPEVARQMVVSTLLGTAKLLDEKGIGFPEMIRRVATKGGITEEGVNVLNHHLPTVFDQVFERTLAKHEMVKEKIRGIRNSDE